ncbi:MAG: pilus assembly protein N-terminal domain-containing protein, partial [Rhodospirillales bacterium]|nr:pilus assembly protein N-terminal domain-containing protein [Rhodospirillales bacterium]
MLPLRMPIALWLLAALAMAMMTVAPTAWAQPANPVEIVGPSATPLQIEAQKGQLLRLPRAAQSVFVADPEVADVQVKSPTLIYVFGKKAGETTLYAVDAREAVLLNARVVVTHNLSRLRTAIAQLNLDTEIDL